MKPSSLLLFVLIILMSISFSACERCKRCRVEVNSRSYIDGVLITETDSTFNPVTACGDQLDLFEDGPRYDTSSVNFNGSTTERADRTTYFCE